MLSTAGVGAWALNQWNDAWMREQQATAAGVVYAQTPCMQNAQGGLNHAYIQRVDVSRTPAQTVIILAPTTPAECSEALLAKLHQPEIGLTARLGD